MDESIELYGITAREFAENNAIFMMNLQTTVFENMLIDSDQNFWNQVRLGAIHTITISQSLIKNLDHVNLFC
jgi:hypothetical protein